eukprot:m.920189 g.920189  ORF g.920189 m.920189 type:complete len:182 (+) comp61909_c0_seq1:40-585(+)
MGSPPTNFLDDVLASSALAPRARPNPARADRTPSAPLVQRLTDVASAPRLARARLSSHGDIPAFSSLQLPANPARAKSLSESHAFGEHERLVLPPLHQPHPKLDSTADLSAQKPPRDKSKQKKDTGSNTSKRSTRVLSGRSLKQLVLLKFFSCCRNFDRSFRRVSCFGRTLRFRPPLLACP